jgi:hypothetical protein
MLKFFANLTEQQIWIMSLLFGAFLIAIVLIVKWNGLLTVVHSIKNKVS